VRGISIKCSQESQAPKLIKIAVNNPNIGFDEVQDAVEPQVAQIIELDVETVTSGNIIPLRFVRFQSVLSLHVSAPRAHHVPILIFFFHTQIFVSSNQGAEDETRIDSIDIFGLPGQCVHIFCPINCINSPTISCSSTGPVGCLSCEQETTTNIRSPAITCISCVPPRHPRISRKW
jgi:hypothetical protein